MSFFSNSKHKLYFARKDRRSFGAGLDYTSREKIGDLLERVLDHTSREKIEELLERVFDYTSREKIEELLERDPTSETTKWLGPGLE